LYLNFKYSFIMLRKSLINNQCYIIAISVFFFVWMLVNGNCCKAQSPYGLDEINYGLMFSHSDYPSLPASQTGGGVYGHMQVSLLDLLIFKHKPFPINIGDLVGATFGIGGRETINPNGFTDPLPIDNFWLMFGFDLGAQAHVRWEKMDMDFGLEYFYQGKLEAANSLSANSVTNDYDLVNLQYRYRNYMVEWAIPTQHSFLSNPKGNGNENNKYRRFAFKYFPLAKAGLYFGLQWEQYFNNKQMAGNFVNNNFRLMSGYFF